MKNLYYDKSALIQGEKEEILNSNTGCIDLESVLFTPGYPPLNWVCTQIDCLNIPLWNQIIDFFPFVAV